MKKNPYVLLICIVILLLSISTVCVFSDTNCVTKENAQGTSVPMAQEYPRCKSVCDAGAIMRKEMVKHSDVIRFHLGVKTNDINKYLKSFDKKLFKEAFKHTSNPMEGEYLRGQYSGYERHISCKEKNGNFELDFEYCVTYYNTLKQEAALKKEIITVLSKMDIESKDDYETVKTIYDYVTKNVEYDNDRLDKEDYTSGTAYNAIVYGKAICQGYSQLVKLMLEEVGIPCRVYIKNIKNGGANTRHAWNIIKIGEKYYFADATWDAANRVNGKPYEYFLMGKNDFENHETYCVPDEYLSYPEVSSTGYIVSKHSSPVVKSIKKTSIKRVSASKHEIKVEWKNLPVGVVGYQLQYSSYKTFKQGKHIIVSDATRTSTKIARLKANTKYYTRIRTYKVLEGKKYYSAWSKAKSIKTQ